LFRKYHTRGNFKECAGTVRREQHCASLVHRKNNIDAQEKQNWRTRRTDSVADVCPTVNNCNIIGAQENRIPILMFVSTAPHRDHWVAPRPTEMRSIARCKQLGGPRPMGCDRPVQPARAVLDAGSTCNSARKDRCSPRRSGGGYRQPIADCAGYGSIESNPIPKFVID
jgi:hypothetical protein